MVAAALTAGALPVFLLSALSPEIARDLVLDPAALGVAISAFFLASAVASVPGGRTADRFGAGVALRAGLGLTAVAALVVALLVDRAPTLVAASFLGGSSLGLIDTGGARALSARVRPRRQGLAFGAKEASVPTASLLAGMSVPVIAAQLGWRAAFLIAAVVAVVVAFATPRRLEPAEERDESTGASPAGREAARTPEGSGAPVPLRSVGAPSRPREISRERATTRRSVALVALAAAAGLGGGAAASAATFLVPAAVEAGWSEPSAALLLSAASAAGITARLGVGVLADRRVGTELSTVTTLLALGALGVLSLSVAQGPLVVVGAVLAIGAGWGWTGLVFLAAVRIDPVRPARAAGTVLAGLGTGGAAGPAVFGVVADSAGYGTAWVVTAAAMFVASGCTTAARRRAAAG